MNAMVGGLSGSKMSSSDPDSKVDLLDSSESVQLKASQVPPGILRVAWGLFRLFDHVSSDDQQIDLGGSKATIGVGWRTDDWFAANVEAGVDQHRATGASFKGFE